jgi:predicted SAM-dependent methyltransferase
MRQIEIGPGPYPLDGFESVDCVGAPNHWACWGVDRLPFDDNSVDLIYASHVLEHVPWQKTGDALAEAYRILKPGGSIEVWVPDFEYIVECYRYRTCGDSWRRDNPEGDPMKWINGRLYAYGDLANHHRATFDAEYLGDCLRRAGFVQRSKLTKPRGYDHGPVGLGMRGVK